MKGCYLIHFSRYYKHAGHYLGFSEDIERRIEAHSEGRGARLMEVVKHNGIEWVVARTWPNATRSDERRLKNQKNAPKLCPICRELRRRKRGQVPMAELELKHSQEDLP